MVNNHEVNIGLCFLSRNAGGLFIFVCRVFFFLFLSKRVAVPQDSMQEGQVAVPGASPCPPIPPVSSTRMSRDGRLTSAVGTVILFCHAHGPPGSYTLLSRRQRRAVLPWQLPWDAAWLPHPPPNPGKTPMSPGVTCTVALACSSFHSRALLMGKAGHRGCSGSASNHCGDAECARSASLPGTDTLKSKQSAWERRVSWARTQRTSGMSDQATQN